ncbi:MAG TPA: GNAT family N-acetyltransferase [Herpetosiphonaceae bacterium]|nr:GNAT family N-acetyltransferase [Herpetosiphonaceae bacterium]
MSRHHDFRIRDARPEDGDKIRAVTLAAYEQYADVMPHWQMYRRQHLLATLEEQGPEERIVAERNGEIIGSVLLYPATATVYETETANAGWPEIRLLAVPPSVRGQGVGKALLDECVRRARGAGATTLGLHSEDIMEAAVHLYQRTGFVRAPETDFNPSETAVVKGYRLSLDDTGAAPE